MKFSPEVNDALVRLSADSDFKLLVSALADDAEKLNQTLIFGGTNTSLEVLQGMARQSVLLLTAITEARENLNKQRQQG